MEQTYILEKSESEKEQGWGVAPVDLWEDLPGGLSGQGGYTYDMNDLKCGMKFVMEIHMP